MCSETTRRMFLYALAGAPLLAAGLRTEARETVLARLIRQAQKEDDLARRVDFISRTLVGTRYQSHTLIGGPRRKEQFVLREDAFDCVTYCEAVLAAALSKDYSDYPDILRRIRYAQDEVRWEERNHDFAQWSERIVAKRICRPVALAPSVTIEKNLSGEGLGKRHYAITAATTPALLAQRKALQAGDVIGFVSRRPGLDFFHIGFIAFDRSGTLLVRHASQSQGQVVNEAMTSFVARTGVKHVTLLRAQEPLLAEG